MDKKKVFERPLNENKNKSAATIDTSKKKSEFSKISTISNFTYENQKEPELHEEEELYEEQEVEQENVVYISDEPSSTDSSCGNTSSEEEDEARYKDIFMHRNKNMPNEYWHIQKVIKWIKISNQTGTLVALAHLLDLLSDNEPNSEELEAYEYALLDYKGLEILINILETDDLSCRDASLKVIQLLCNKNIIKREFINLGILKILMKIVPLPAPDVQYTALSVLSKLASMRKARRLLRTCKYFPVLMQLDIPDKCLQTKLKDLNDTEKQQVRLGICAMKLWGSLAESKKCRDLMRQNNFVLTLSRYLKSVHWEAVIATMGAIATCCVDKQYRMALVVTKDMVKDIFYQLVTVNHIHIKRYTSQAVASTAADQNISRMIREFHGLPVIVKLMKHSSVLFDDGTMASVTAAILALANNKENREEFYNLNTMSFMFRLLNHSCEDIVSNAVGTLSELLKVEKSVRNFRLNDGVSKVMDLFNTTFEPLIINILLTLEQGAQYDELIPAIEENDGIRQVWSLIRHKSTDIKTRAAWCLVPLLRNTPDSGEIVKNLVGGFDLVISLLKSYDSDILAAALALLTEIAADFENLNVLTHLELIPLLARHFQTENLKIKEYLSHMIAASCLLEENTKELTRRGAIGLLISYLQHPKLSVQKSAVKALSKMTSNPFNCITIKDSGIDYLLKKYIDFYDDVEMQSEAANCLKNIRNLCIDSEQYYLKQIRRHDFEDDERREQELFKRNSRESLGSFQKLETKIKRKSYDGKQNRIDLKFRIRDKNYS